jgi:CRP-like cAMP-binding protein
VFGEETALFNKPASFKVVAVQECELYFLTKNLLASEVPEDV